MRRALPMVLAALGAGCAHEAMPGALGGEAGQNMVLPSAPDTHRGVALEVEPEDAEVVVDGVVQGIASDFDGKAGMLHLSDGAHRIAIRKKGFLPYESTLFGSSDGFQRVHVDLVSE